MWPESAANSPQNGRRFQISFLRHVAALTTARHRCDVDHSLAPRQGPCRMPWRSMTHRLLHLFTILLPQLLGVLLVSQASHISILLGERAQRGWSEDPRPDCRPCFPGALYQPLYHEPRDCPGGAPSRSFTSTGTAFRTRLLGALTSHLCLKLKQCVFIVFSLPCLEGLKNYL